MIVSINHVKILYAQMDKSPNITVNGEALSRYSELADYVDNDIFLWAEKLFDYLDMELNDEYDISIVGHEIHHLFIAITQRKSEYCRHIEFTRIQARIPLAEKINYAFRQSEVLSINVGNYPRQIEVCCPSEITFSSFEINNATYTPTLSTYYICNENDNYDHIAAKYIICVSAETQVSHVSNSVVIKIQREYLQLLIDYFNSYHIWIDYLTEYFKATLPSVLHLDKYQAAEREAYFEDKIVVLVDELPSSIERGNRVEAQIHCFPKCLPAPYFLILSSDSTIIQVDMRSIIAVGSGACTISISDDSGRKYYEKEIRVYQHTYLDSIKIIAPKTELQVHEMASFRCVLQPANAEDVNEVSYRSSNENVLIVSANNEVYAVGSGRATLSAYTERTSGNLDFTVFAKPEGVRVSPSSVNINFNGSAELSCSIIPQNISPMPTVTWSSTNPNIIKIQTVAGYNCRVYCVGLGQADVFCRIDGSDITGSAHFITPQPKKRCYVATAVYGTYDCPQLWVLRRFRDNYLEHRYLGRAFIRMYYFISPKIINVFGKTKWFNRLWRHRLNKFTAYLKEKGYTDTPYVD